MCDYPGGAPNRRGRAEGATGNLEAQIRLQKLEEMVKGLIGSDQSSLINGNAKSSTYPSDSEHQTVSSTGTGSSNCGTPSEGRLNIVGSEAKYLGATHWESILDSVSIRGYNNAFIAF